MKTNRTRVLIETTTIQFESVEEVKQLVNGTLVERGGYICTKQQEGIINPRGDFATWETVDKMLPYCPVTKTMTERKEVA